MTLVEQVLDFVGESAGSVYWPLAHVYDATNAAIVWAWIDCNSSQTVDNLRLVSGATLADLSNFQNVMIPKKVVGPEGDVWVSKQHDMERENQWWRTDSASLPRVLLDVDNYNVRLWPPPDDDYSYDVYGLEWPPEVGTISGDVYCDELLKHAIAALAASWLVEDTHPELSDFLQQEYLQYRDGFMRSWRSKGEGGIVMLRPANHRQRPFGGVVKFTRSLQ